MNYRKLGKSNLSISEVSFGCMSLNEDFINAEKLIHKAIDYGVNYFDTADLYQKGMNEKMIGKALKDHRKNNIIATKVGNQLNKDKDGWDWNPSKKHIMTAVEDSLRRLQTDYIDLYQLHGGTIQDSIDETIDAFETLVREGKIRYYGISSIRPNVIREYIKRSNIVSVMMQYSLLDRRPEEECLPLLQENNIGVLARGSLAKGLLAGKPADTYLHHSQEEVKNAADAIKEISNTSGASSCGIALGFVLNHPAITSAVVGIRTEKQLEECFGSLKDVSLSSKETTSLKTQVTAGVYSSHR